MNRWMVSRWTIGLLALLALGGAAACSSPSEPVTYSLPLTRIEPLATELRYADVVMVDGFGADSVLARRAIAWRELDAPNEIHTYSRHLWNEAPTRMVQAHLVSCLRSARAFAVVIYPYERASADVVLSGELRRFEQVVDDAGGSAAMITVDVSLSDRTRRGLILQDRISATAPARDIAPGSVVDAFEAALRALCVDLVARLTESR